MSDPTISLIRLSRQDARDVHLWLLDHPSRPAEASEFRAKLSNERYYNRDFASVAMSDENATAFYEWLERRQGIPDALVRLRTSLADRLGKAEAWGFMVNESAELLHLRELVAKLRLEVQDLRAATEIEVKKNKSGFIARVAECFDLGIGNTREEAIGSLVRLNPSRFNIKITEIQE